MIDTIDTKAHSVQAVRAAGNRLQADAYVLTAGTWTGRLARSIGIRLPIIAGKGYSFTMTEPNLNVRHPLYLGDTKVAVSPYNGALRVGGTMEFSGFNTHLDPKRLDSIRAASRLYFRIPPAGQSTEIWAGMRPMTPDGLPVIGRTAKYGNLFIASGHGSDGIFMAPATASLLCEIMRDHPLPPQARAFHPDRFS